MSVALRCRSPRRRTVRVAVLLLVLLCAVCARQCRGVCEGTTCYTASQRTNTHYFLRTVAESLSPYPTFNMDDSTNFCDWDGVSCTPAGVTYSRAWSGVSGTLPELSPAWNASEIVVLGLSFSANALLNCTLPSSWGQLTSLVTLDLDSTAVSGTLPPSWSGMTALRSFSCSTTSIEGTLPAAWHTLTKLQSLFLQNTHVQGTIPDSWNEMTALQTVQLSDTAVTCCLPRDWLCQRNLTTAGVGMTSAASQACPTATEVCSDTLLDYTSSCPAYPTTPSTSTTTTSTSAVETTTTASAGSTSSTRASVTTTTPPPASTSAAASLPLWAVLLVVLLSVVVLGVVCGLLWWWWLSHGFSLCGREAAIPTQPSREGNSREKDSRSVKSAASGAAFVSANPLVCGDGAGVGGVEGGEAVEVRCCSDQGEDWVVNFDA